jgi:hypothetical protein
VSQFAQGGSAASDTMTSGLSFGYREEGAESSAARPERVDSGVDPV